ncbi:short-chain fatty acids transporter [Christiangramia gaetbulicola]|uniref:Short-chain fatty acids transporter n=1 Tax=Christiangramia gaetbulicola TaxID=703340 RepID=A0A2T6AI61_9FLAO|nr:TIGR00366 family protein [Christiangramia gaetbulicola]PTX43505.1 short-chain fatty acids transporter [Christiangramia gaetbulicola]
MIEKLGEKLTHIYLKYMPNAFVFAILLTLITGLGAYLWLEVTALEIIVSWYDGFFDLLAFAMQIVLIVITGYSIALSPIVKKGIDFLARYITSPWQVYFIVVFMGLLLTLISFGWIVITCVLARELALRVKGVNYPFLTACVYFSANTWVSGFSSSIPLLLNTENNFLINSGILEEVIPTSYTLGSTLNITMIFTLLILAPLVILILRPKNSSNKEIRDLMISKETTSNQTIKEEALSLKLPFRSYSDKMNNSSILQMIIVIMGLVYIIYHFSSKGFDLNFNIMIFIFIISGLLLHKTPMRYVISMKRSSSNVSGILFQYPFYAGIMGIMLYTGLGEKLGQLMAAQATIDSYPFYAYLTGGVVNFAIPSAGGEFAVVGPSIINAVKEIGAGLPAVEITELVSRASLAVAYGESLSNLLQPFYLLLVLPIMAAGIKVQARDVMGYLVLPFIIFFIIQSLLVLYCPM